MTTSLGRYSSDDLSLIFTVCPLLHNLMSNLMASPISARGGITIFLVALMNEYRNLENQFNLTSSKNS